MGRTPEQIDDIVNTTLPLIKRIKWTDLSLEHQEYVAPEMLARKGVFERGGTQISFRLQTKNTGNAQLGGLYGQVTPKVEDVTIQGNVPWSKVTTNFSYDIDEPEFQSDKEQIIQLLVLRKHDAHNSMVELKEQYLWSEPNAPTTDTQPMGAPFWVQKDPTTTPDGDFNGGNPSGFPAGRAGVSSAIYPRWRNWAGGYTNVTCDDLVRKVKKALAYTNFHAPVPHPTLGYGKADRIIYTTYRVVEPLERLAESRNDNLGRDVAKYINQVLIGGVPTKHVFYLTANDTLDPLYGINWSKIRPFIKSGCNMRQSKPLTPYNQPTVRTVHYDLWYNYCCYDLRSQWVLSKAA